MKSMKFGLDIVLGVVALAQLTGCCCPCGYGYDVVGIAPPLASQARAVTEHVAQQPLTVATPAPQKY